MDWQHSRGHTGPDTVTYITLLRDKAVRGQRDVRLEAVKLGVQNRPAERSVKS